MEKIKVLCFVDRLLLGGIQKLVFEYAERINKSKVQIDFLTLDDGNHYELEDKLLNKGFTIYKLKGVWLNNISDFVRYKKAINHFFASHNDYKVVHLNSTSKNYMVLKYAQKYNIPVRIAHSHSTGFQTSNLLKKMFGNILKIKLNEYATDYFACSKSAGEWLFGKKIVNSSNFKVIHNGVDCEKYIFNQSIRNEIRKNYGIEKDTIVLGHVGRFQKVKNHDFLIDVFYEYHQLNLNSKLMLVGTGSLVKEIEYKVDKLNLTDSVIFVGFKNNVCDYLQSMDAFVFPSKFEGLGMGLIESQASGLPSFASKDVIPDEVKVSEQLEFISLKESAKEWAKKIYQNKLKRVNTMNDLKKQNYEIKDIALYLENFYINR